MAFKLAEIFTDITVRDNQFKKGMDDSENRLKRFGASALKVAGVAAGMFTTAIAVGSKFVQMANEQIRSEARLEAVLKATGNAAGFTSDQLKKQAAALQEVAGLGDEVIMQGQAILATFKNVSGEAFERTTKAALDLAAVTGQDLRSSVLQLGKALNDPATQLTALRRSGVSFSDEQVKMVKKLVETNKMLEAQDLILKEIESQFGGASYAMTNTFGGQLIRLQNTLGDIGEEIGKSMIGPLGEITGMMQSAIPTIKAFFNTNKEGGKAIGEGAKFVREFVEGAVILVKAMASLVRYTSDLSDKLGSLKKLSPFGGINTDNLSKGLSLFFGNQGAAPAVRDTGNLAQLMMTQNKLQAEGNEISKQQTALGR